MHAPDPIVDFCKLNQCRGPAVSSLASLKTPASQVMRTGDDAGANAIGHPDTIDEVSNLGRDTCQVTRLHTNAFCIDRMDPDRIGIGDLVQPFCVP